MTGGSIALQLLMNSAIGTPDALVLIDRSFSMKITRRWINLPEVEVRSQMSVVRIYNHEFFHHLKSLSTIVIDFDDIHIYMITMSNTINITTIGLRDTRTGLLTRSLLLVGERGSIGCSPLRLWPCPANCWSTSLVSGMNDDRKEEPGASDAPFLENGTGSGSMSELKHGKSGFSESPGRHPPAHTRSQHRNMKICTRIS